jgi:hypothetical protein
MQMQKQYLLSINKQRELNQKILFELHLSKKKTFELYKKLEDYRYIENTEELKEGSIIRWIPIEDPTNLYLTNTAIFCHWKNNEYEENLCICKNFGWYPSYFTIDLDKTLVFQKLSQQEKILLYAIEQLDKDNLS